MNTKTHLFTSNLCLLVAFVSLLFMASCKQEEAPGESLNFKVYAKGATGTEEIILVVNNAQIRTWKLETDFTEFATQIDSGLVQIYFSNAGGVRSAEIDYIELNGRRYEAEDQLVNTSVFQDGVCGGANSQLMNCNGFIQFFSNVISKKTTASTVNLTDEKQIIRGFGGATAFSPYAGWSLTASDYNLLYGTGNGQIGFNILRIRLASDDDPTWRNRELTHAKEVIARGGIVVATPWSPPVRMKTNNNLIGGSLRTDAYADYATYLNDFANFMADNEAPLYGVSIQNEPDIQVTYESCDWTPNQMFNFVKNNADVITATKLIAPESFNFNHSVSNPFLLDDAAVQNVDIVGGHIYGSGLMDYFLARSKGKEVWMTEHLNLETTWEAAFSTGREIHDCLAVANFNAYIWWYLKRFYGPLDENGSISKRGHVMSNFSKFIRPDYHRVGAREIPQENIRVSAYKGEKTVIVVLNESDTAVEQQFAFDNGTVDKVSPYLTNQSLNLSKQPDVRVINGIFSYMLPPKSIITFVEAD